MNNRQRVLMAGAVLAAGCSGRGEIIPTPSPEPQTPTTGQPIVSAVLPPDLTIATPVPTTEPAPTTTEAPATTLPRATTTSLRPQTTTPAIDYSSLPYNGWAIPEYIVMCESRGRWDARNPSGASGPYQLMPLHFNGELAMHQSREAQHAKAAQLWNGGKGKHHWSECL